MRLMICTSNQGKFREISSMLKDLDVEFVMPPYEIEVEETGNTFLANAYLKAKAYYEAFKIPALADDSGIEIEALGGRPGVFSARFYKQKFGSHVLKEEDYRLPKDEINNLKVLRLLENEENRKARFVTVLTVFLSNSQGVFGEGELRGTIAREPAGTLGFGYDSIFVPDGYDVTLAQIEHKNQISHRKKALEALIGVLRGALGYNSETSYNEYPFLEI